MRLLVTGGLGFIGSNFIIKILKETNDFEIVNVDAELFGSNQQNLEGIKDSDRYEFVKGNITNKNLMTELISKCDSVVNFAAGGIASPADAALMMQIGVEGVFVGSGIFKSSDPQKMANAIVKATTHYNDPKIIAEISKGLGDAMPGLDVRTMPEEEQLSVRGW